MRFASSLSGLGHSLSRTKVICLRTRLFTGTVGFINPVHGTLRFPAIFGLLKPLIGPDRPGYRLLNITGLSRVHLCGRICRGVNVSCKVMGDVSNCSRVSLADSFGIAAGGCREVFGPRSLNFRVTGPRRMEKKTARRRTGSVFSTILRGHTLPTRGGVILTGTTFNVRIVRGKGGDVSRYIRVTHRDVSSKGTLTAFGGFIRLGDWKG